jgi:hypothetical protein
MVQLEVILGSKHLYPSVEVRPGLSRDTLNKQASVRVRKQEGVPLEL